MSHFVNVQGVSYNVIDWERARKFYAEVLGWPVAWVDDQMGWCEYGREGETHIAISHWRGPDPIPPKEGGATAILTVEDAHAVARELRAQGVRCDDVIVIPGVVTYGTFYDPEGNRLQFVSSQPPPAAA